MRGTLGSTTVMEAVERWSKAAIPRERKCVRERLNEKRRVERSAMARRIEVVSDGGVRRMSVARHRQIT